MPTTWGRPAGILALVAALAMILGFVVTSEPVFIIAGVVFAIFGACFLIWGDMRKRSSGRAGRGSG